MDRHLSTPISCKRPLGVTVRGFLYLIEGSIAIFLGVLLSTLTQYITTYLKNFSERHEFSLLLQILNSSFSPVLIIWLIVSGGAGIIIGIGVIKGKRWAWKITIIQTLLSISVGLIYFAFPNTSDPTSNFIGASLELIIGIVLVCYFYQPHVRAYFNRLPTQ